MMSSANSRRLHQPIFWLTGAVWTVIVVALAGCGVGGAQLDDPVIVVASPVPPDSGFVTYTHPTGAFSLRMPPDWIAGELPDSSGVRVQFTQIEDGEAVTRLSVYVVNTGRPMTAEAFAAAADAYQPPEDLATYGWHEIERVAQRDGSRRITGVRAYPSLGPRALNIFLQGDGAFFSALEADVTGLNPDQLSRLRAVINTFRVDPTVELVVGEVQQAQAGAVSQSGVINFDAYTDWIDQNGTYHITGQVINTTFQPLEAVRLSGVLYDTQGRRLAEQSNILAVDVLQPGQNAPFDLRFEGGKPASTVRYELNVAAREADFILQEYYGPENFSVANEEAVYNAQDVLVIRGDLANIGPQIAEAVKVVVAVWDSAGHIVGMQTVFISKAQLLPQEAVSFEVPFYELGGEPALFTWTVVGSVAERASE